MLEIYKKSYECTQEGENVLSNVDKEGASGLEKPTEAKLNDTMEGKVKCG